MRLHWRIERTTGDSFWPWFVYITRNGIDFEWSTLTLTHWGAERALKRQLKRQKENVVEEGYEES